MRKQRRSDCEADQRLFRYADSTVLPPPNQNFKILASSVGI